MKILEFLFVCANGKEPEIRKNKGLGVFGIQNEIWIYERSV